MPFEGRTLNGPDGPGRTRDGSGVFLPDLCAVRPLFTLVIMSELFAFVIVLAKDPDVRPWYESLALVSLYVQWITLASAAAICASRRGLGRLSVPTAAVASFAIILGVTVLVSFAAFWVLSAGGAATEALGLSARDFVLRSVGIATVVAVVLLRYFYVQDQWRRRTESESRARVEVLKARIRPHFLFNCMNTIASLTSVDPAAAEKAIEDLADLFRASLKDADDTVPIGDEVALARQYLGIEQLRLGDRLDVAWEIAPDTGDIRLPVLTLQPLVENAIYHGIEPLEAGGTIGIRIARDGRTGIIEVTNPRVPDVAGPRAGNRQAQRNIAGRLEAYFGPEARLDITTGTNDYRVEVRVPAVEASA